MAKGDWELQHSEILITISCMINYKSDSQTYLHNIAEKSWESMRNHQANSQHRLHAAT